MSVGYNQDLYPVGQLSLVQGRDSIQHSMQGRDVAVAAVLRTKQKGAMPPRGAADGPSRHPETHSL